MEEGKVKSTFGIVYRVFYTDETGHNREKSMRLESADNAMYFFYNMVNHKKEAIPKRFINRMEAVE